MLWPYFSVVLAIGLATGLPAELAHAQDAPDVLYVSPAVGKGKVCWRRDTAVSMAQQELVNKASDMCRAQPGKWVLNRKAIKPESYGQMQCHACDNSPGEFTCTLERSRMPCEAIGKKAPEKSGSASSGSTSPAQATKSGTPERARSSASSPGTLADSLGARLDKDYENRKRDSVPAAAAGSESTRTGPARVADAGAQSSRPSAPSGAGGTQVGVYLVYAPKSTKKNMGYVVGWTSVPDSEMKNLHRGATSVLIDGKEAMSTRITGNQDGGYYENPAINAVVRRFKSAIENSPAGAAAAEGKDQDGVCVREKHGTQCKSGIVVLNGRFTYEHFVKMHKEHIGNNMPFTVFTDFGAF